MNARERTFSVLYPLKNIEKDKKAEVLGEELDPGALHVGVQSVTQAAKSASPLTPAEAEPTSVAFTGNTSQEHTETKARSQNRPWPIGTSRKVSGGTVLLPFSRENPFARGRFWAFQLLFKYLLFFYKTNSFCWLRTSV